MYGIWKRKKRPSPSRKSVDTRVKQVFYLRVSVVVVAGGVARTDAISPKLEGMAANPNISEISRWPFRVRPNIGNGFKGPGIEKPTHVGWGS